MSNVGNQNDNLNNPPPEEEIDDDFPEYANEQNKQMNQIIQEKRKLIQDIKRKTEQKDDRQKVLEQHYQNVQQELLHTQALIDAKNQEVETEDHMRQVTERQIGRIESQMRKLQKLAIENQEKLNDVQNQIFRGNEKMDQYKLEMNWNQEELEQWALAARQQEEDNLTLEKYKRTDEVRIKELNLKIEELTGKVGQKQNEVDQEITETQASQIELDKTSQEFRKHHEERHKIFEQWQEVSEIIRKRDQAIRDEGQEFAQIKIEINKNFEALSERKRLLDQQIDQNQQKSIDNELLDRDNIRQIAENKKLEESLINLKAEVEIKKNQVSAFASSLTNIRNRISVLSEDLLVKKQRLNNAQKKYNSNLTKLKNEEIASQTYQEQREMAEDQYKRNEKEMKDLAKKIEQEKDALLKATEVLFKLRENEANLYGDIQGQMAACRNLQSHINKLNQEFQRQQELLYNAEYQIQQMERKVARAKGDRTLEQKKDLEKEEDEAKNNLSVVEDMNKLLVESLKKLDDDLRAIQKKFISIKEDKQKYNSKNEELTLENDMTYQDLKLIVKQKEDVLVNHDCMKLEIKKISDNLQKEINIVLGMENRKYQLEMSMQEREEEIQVHRDVLLTEHKAAEEERHKIAVELAERKNKVKNLKIKYESLVQKNKASSGQVENVQEHSQAYFVIKAAQEREELQRKGDELNAQILQSMKELKALENTLSHLKNRNSNLREGFLNKGVTMEDRQQKDAIEDQCRAASENLFKKQKQLQKVQQEYEEDMRRYTEIQNKMEMLNNQNQEFQQMINNLRQELNEQKNKVNRAAQSRENIIKKLEEKQIELDESNPHIIQLEYDKQNLLTQTILSALVQLSTDIPEVSPIVDEYLKQRNMALPSKPPSSIDIQSQRSSGSSVRSGGSSHGRR